MKTLKIIPGLIFLLTLGLLSSCTKPNRPAELSIDAQTLEFDSSVLSRSFNVVNIGDDLLVVEAYSDENWVSVIGGKVSLSNAATSLINVQIHPEFFQEYGVYTADLYVNSNGGNFIVPLVVYYSQSASAILALDLDYLKFSTNSLQNYFTLYNDGSEDLNFLLQTEASWIQFSQEIGTIAINNEQKIYVNVDRTALLPGIYSAEINITTSGGNAILDVDMDVEVYSITFFNPVYTAIEIKTSRYDPIVVDPGERYSFVFNNNPSSFRYSANTIGETAEGNPLGVRINWEETIDVSDFDSPTFNLNVSSDYFFMAVKNTGNYNLEMWSVNYGNDFQIDDDFNIPNDGIEYGVAYYEAFEDTDIYARLSGTSDDVKWSQGVEFVFPWTENQYILLSNNFKKSAVIRTGMKSTSAQQLKVKAFNKSAEKSKGSIDLYNKK
ncbi:MAG: hypothetical protein J7J72_08480 [Bacteroidales bacterium]|nr:hypothetical protein [Bacteroidales bacterium]